MFSAVVLASTLSMIASLENVSNERLAKTALGFGVAFSALTVLRLVVQIPLGRLSDRIGRKKPIVAGLVAPAPITALFGHVARPSSSRACGFCRASPRPASRHRRSRWPATSRGKAARAAR